MVLRVQKERGFQCSTVDSQWVAFENKFCVLQAVPPSASAPTSSADSSSTAAPSSSVNGAKRASFAYVIRTADIPFPSSSSDLFSSEMGPAAKKQRVRKLQLQWHPDKFFQKFGEERLCHVQN